MEITSLVIASALIVVPIAISYKEHLGLEKEIIISMLRAVIQLVIVGYLLEVLFGLHNPIVTTCLITVMVANAAYNTKKRGKYVENVVAISFLAIVIGTAITLAVLVFAGAIAFVPQEVIPVSGMIISNAMVAVGLGYKSLEDGFDKQRTEVEVKLALGATPKVAAQAVVKDSIKMAMLPSIDSAKTLGIVSLPGMMTGLILAGSSPMVAIKFQIMVTFMILSAASMSTIIATYLAYKSFFNERKQLIISKKNA